MLEAGAPTVRHVGTGLGVAELVGVGLGLTALAVAAPVALYVVALSAFGLPHVLWEMAWLRQTRTRGLPAGWWLSVGGVIALQAAARLGGWRGALDADVVATLDLLTLAALALTVLAAWKQLARPGLTLACALLMAIALIASVHLGLALSALALLSIAHNFTPLALAPAQARMGRLALRPTLYALFALPCILGVALLLGAGDGGATFAAHASPLLPTEPLPAELRWLQGLDARAGALLPALVLAQCLHYYSVIRLMPASVARGAWRMGFKHTALVASALLAGYFAHNFSDARGLYAVAAGAHAWLEWPVMLLLIGGWAHPPERNP